MYKLGFCIHGPLWCVFGCELRDRARSLLPQPLPAPEDGGAAADSGAGAPHGHAPRAAGLLRVTLNAADSLKSLRKHRKSVNERRRSRCFCCPDELLRDAACVALARAGGGILVGRHAVLAL